MSKQLTLTTPGTVSLGGYEVGVVAEVRPGRGIRQCFPNGACARFFAIFDCCHSGAITRDGTHAARGLTPPDDIRHRMLRWNVEERIREERPWKEQDKINDTYGGTAQERREMMGSNGVTYRLGRGMRLRKHLSKAGSKRLVKQKSARYLPALLEACGEGQLSYE